MYVPDSKKNNAIINHCKATGIIKDIEDFKLKWTGKIFKIEVDMPDVCGNHPVTFEK